MDMKPPYASPVKEYSQETYLVEEDSKLCLDNTVTWRYNQFQKINEIDQRNSNKDYSEKSVYTYDSDQRVKEVRVLVAEGEQKKVTLYEYQDNLLDQTTEVAGDYQILIKYDDHGNPAEKRNYTRSNVLISTTMLVNMYDDLGRLVEKHTIFPSGESNWIDRFKYDADGRLIEEQKIRNQMVSNIQHSYNDRGDLILSDFNPGEINHEMLKREIAYSPDNDILEIKEYRKGWCYQDRNDEFGLTAVLKYTYLR